MFPFPPNTNILMACHFSGIYDVNRSQMLPNDDFSLVKEWVESIASLQMNGILFHNNLSEATCKAHENEYIKFIKITCHDFYNPNVYRYFVYKNFLKENAHQLTGCFVTDVTDVVAVRNPFADPLFINHPHTLFCGDEPKTLDNEWMRDHSSLLRSRIAGFAAYEAAHQNTTLLNCGIIGGQMQMMLPFIERLCHIHQEYNHDNQTAYTGDMGAFNYLARTQYNDHLYHGVPVNTVFKAFETERKNCWFRHK